MKLNKYSSTQREDIINIHGYLQSCSVMKVMCGGPGVLSPDC